MKYYYLENKNNKRAIPVQISSVKDYLLLLLTTMDSFLLNADQVSIADDRYSIPKPDTASLLIYKRRMFVFVNENKYFSVSFPFDYSPKELCFRLHTKTKEHGVKLTIDSLVLSHLRLGVNIISEDKSLSNAFYLIKSELSQEGMQPEYIGEVEEALAVLYKGESCYIRYDNDLDTYKKNYKHALNHLDIFFSDYKKFKIGLWKRMSTLEFIKLLDNDIPAQVLSYASDSGKVAIYDLLRELNKKERNNRRGIFSMEVDKV